MAGEKDWATDKNEATEALDFPRFFGSMFQVRAARRFFDSPLLRLTASSTPRFFDSIPAVRQLVRLHGGQQSRPLPSHASAHGSWRSPCSRGVLLPARTLTSRAPCMQPWEYCSLLASFQDAHIQAERLAIVDKVHWPLVVSRAPGRRGRARCQPQHTHCQSLTVCLRPARAGGCRRTPEGRAQSRRQSRRQSRQAQAGADRPPALSPAAEPTQGACPRADAPRPPRPPRHCPVGRGGAALSRRG
jgi:hypothetical protein